MSGLTMSGTANTSPIPPPSGALELTESSGRALKLQTDTPHLVSMGGGRLSTSVTLHPIPPGRVTIGSSPGVDILVQGTGVAPVHCHIENNEGVVVIYPLSENLSIDGAKITGPTRLSQGVMLTIGRSNYLRFNHPAEAKLMKSLLPTPRISMAPIQFEVDNMDSSKINKKPPVAPKKNSRESLSDSSGEEPPSNIMTKVSKFEYLAAQNLKKAISPKVFSSNLVTVTIPAKHVLGNAPPDLHSLTKNLPQSALNYSELNSNINQKNKTPDRQIFGKKSPQYVNVTLNEAKPINQRVILFENEYGSKQQNNQHMNNLNNANVMNNTSNHLNKTVNLSCNMQMPSPSYNRNPTFRSVTPSPVSNNVNASQRLSGSVGDLNGKVGVSGSLEDLAQRKNEAELKRNQAQVDRIKEQEIEKAEQARLEEILNMCAEYEKSQTEKNSKLTPNRIKTNGSLPRDKRPGLKNGSPNHPSPTYNDDVFRFETEHVSHYSNTRTHTHYENVEINLQESDLRYQSSSENSSPQVQQSPRTRIKTFVSSTPSHMRDTTEVIESKFAVVNAEHNLLLNRSKGHAYENHEIITGQKNPSKELENSYSKRLDNYENVKITYGKVINNNLRINDIPRQEATTREKYEMMRKRIDSLKRTKKDKLLAIAKLKCHLTELENQDGESIRDMELEKVLVAAECKTKRKEMEDLQVRKELLQKKAHEIEDLMRNGKEKQLEYQNECREKLHKAQEHMRKMERQLSETGKTSPQYDTVFEDYLTAQEILDNEKKNYEDLEFHYLEQEADLLASREELQREIVDLSHKIEMIRRQIEDLEQEFFKTVDDSKEKKTEIEHEDVVRQLNKLHNELKVIEQELAGYTGAESEPELSSDSDSDNKLIEKTQQFNMNNIPNMSCSVIDYSTMQMSDSNNLMTQSFNEKLLQENLAICGERCSSQDDIDRISQVATKNPIIFNEKNEKIGHAASKTLKEIEEKRILHLQQQGGIVIAEERRRLLALKQAAQNEVRSQWEQRRQDCSSFASTGSDEARNSLVANEDSPDSSKKIESSPSTDGEVGDKSEELRAESEGPDSPRPLSEASEISVDVSSVGGTLGKRRTKQNDKHRPLTRYLPIRDSELDLRLHIESAGHQVVLCPHVLINATCCKGFLHKKGSKLNNWSKRWFVFDRTKKALIYYTDKSEKKARGGAFFTTIEEVYLDHANSVKSPNPQLTFIIKTKQRIYHLMAPSPEAMRIWIDVVFTGAEGYQEHWQES